ncbi:exopolysaccharide biosynthesis polyprenyl glycosylphosphotransferase [Reyranella sp.]|uniref:exopolysaccharide biosynthesis polyprenyl glycosylphosphotransferase n=1 Tax=Reyranella sp. TaxID=1929291 RepID=UPI003D0EE3F8
MRASDHLLMDEDAEETGIFHDFAAVVGSERFSPYVFVLVFGALFCIIDTAAVIGAGLVSGELARYAGLEASISQPVIFGLAAAFLILAWVLRIYPRRRAALEGGEIGPVVRLLGGLFAGALATRFGEHGLSFVELGVWAAWLVAATATAKICRLLVASVVRHNVGAAYLQRPTVVVGNNAAALALARGVASDESSPYRLVGFFDDGQGRDGPLTGVLPYIGTLDAVAAFAETYEELDVFLAVPWTAGSRILQLVELLRFMPATIRLIPDLPAFAALDARGAAAAAKLTPVLQTPPLPPYQRMVKAGTDLGLGTIVLVLLTPILLGTALAIKLDSPGPVIFRQPRRGQFGRLFSIYKFRSLHTAKADTNADTLVTKGDPRVTRVGRIIRKYSIDELPQIINVLKGDMSLVGPRPHAIMAKADGKLYGDVVPNYSLRYRVKPGMTGWAQINGWRGETDTEEKLRKRVEFDFYYISHWSWRLDLKILCRTLPAMLFPSAGNS